MRTAVVIAMLALTGCHKWVEVHSSCFHRDDRIDLPAALSYVGHKIAITNGVWEVKLIFKDYNNVESKD